MNIMKSGWRVIVAVSIAAVLWPSQVALAQATGDESAKKETEKPKDKPKANGDQALPATDKPASDKAPKSDKPADASTDKTNKKAKQSDDADGDEGDGANGKAKNPKTAKKKMIKEEAKYRDQMARIDRLREIAKEQNNTERLAALDKLETKLTNLHDRKMNKQKKRLSDDDAKAMDKHLEKGKAQGLSHGKGPDGQGPPGLLKKEEGASPSDSGKKNDNDKGAKATKEDAGSVDSPKPSGAPGEKTEKKDADAPEKEKGGKPDDAGASGDDKGNKGGSKKP